MVTRDVPPYVMAVGRPAAPHSVNSEGLKRRGFTEEQIRNIRRAYRVLYRSGLKLQAALEELERAAASQAEIRPFVDFVKRSSRSLVR
jgi:UDP-N-acetylglucosamine acyltransferase